MKRNAKRPRGQERAQRSKGPKGPEHEMKRAGKGREPVQGL